MRVYLFLFILFYTQNTAYCDIKKVSTYEEAASLILTADENTWVIFDVDEVLITFQNPLMPKYAEQFAQYIYDKSGNMHLINLLYAPYKMKLVHPEWPSLIHSLQNKNIKTIALTKASTGKLSYFNNLTDLRYNTLRNHNIHFNRSFPNLESKKFSKPNTYFFNDNPIFADGIIYTCGLSKPTYLEEFIKYSKEKPNKIIFIDNNEENTKEIKRFCLKEKIEYLCIHYTYIEENNNVFFNEELAQLEFDQIQKDNLFFKSMLPPISPQQEPMLLNLVSIATSDKIQNAPYIDHIEWTKEIYNIIQNTIKTTHKHNNNTKSLLHDLLHNPQNVVQEKYETACPSETIQSEEDFLEKFDQRDARDILKPLLEKIFNFKLNVYDIGSLFLPYNKVTIEPNEEKSDSHIFYKPETQECIFKAAQKTYNLIKNNILFVLGQAPSYLNIMIQEIAHSQNDNDTKIISIPFSGCPDYTQKIPDHYDSKLSYLNIVTHHKESIFRNILYEHHFSPKIVEFKKIYIIDHSNGHSFDSFLNLLKRWFDDEQITYPLTNIIHMGNPTNINITNTHIDSHHFLEMDSELLLAFTSIKDNLRIVPIFNALHWRDDYPKLFKQYPRLDAIPLIEQYKKVARDKIISIK